MASSRRNRAEKSSITSERRHQDKNNMATAAKLAFYLCLSCILGAIVFSHLNARGCVGPLCPDVSALPTSPIQMLLFNYFPRMIQIAEYTNKMACDNGFLSAAACKNLYGVSFIATLVEWCFFGITGTSLMLKLLQRPTTKWLATSLMLFVVLWFSTTVIETYLNDLLPEMIMQKNSRVRDLLTGGVLFSSNVMRDLLELWRRGQMATEDGGSLKVIYSMVKKLVGEVVHSTGGGDL